jgi:hypothetical protein
MEQHASHYLSQETGLAAFHTWTTSSSSSQRRAWMPVLGWLHRVMLACAAAHHCSSVVGVAGISSAAKTYLGRAIHVAQHRQSPLAPKPCTLQKPVEYVITQLWIE